MAYPSGLPELDAVLPGGGWPQGALTEFFVERPGTGELRVLLPMLSRIARDGDPQAWVSPPWLPYAPALAAAGIELSQLVVVRPRTQRVAWTIEQCLRTRACRAVLAWPGQLSMLMLRRLQLAAATGGGCGFLFRERAGRASPSPAALRVAVTPSTGGVHLEIFKVRGGRPSEVEIIWQ